MNNVVVTLFALSTMVAVIVALRALTREARLRDKIEELEVESVETMKLGMVYYNECFRLRTQLSMTTIKLKQCADVMECNDTMNYKIIFDGYDMDWIDPRRTAADIERDLAAQQAVSE